jgi:hypothetical protein
MEEDPQSFQQNLERQVLQGYRIAALILGIFFSALVPYRLLAAQHQARGTLLAWQAAALALFCLVFALIAPWLRRHLGHAENLGLLLVATGLVNSLSLLLILADPDQGANFMLILGIGGLFFLTRWRFLVVHISIFLIWLGGSWWILGFPNVLAWSFPVLGAFMVGLALHLFMGRILGSLKELQIRDQILLRHRARLISDLRDALERVKTLHGLIPMCSRCKKMRNDKGYWEQVESYLEEHSAATITHGLCPQCSKDLQNEFEELLPGGKK